MYKKLFCLSVIKVYYLFGQGDISKEGDVGKAIAILAGSFLVGSSAWYAMRLPSDARAKSLRFSLLFYILYICCTALLTAGGRLTYGRSFALISRYTTPGLIVWATLLVLYSPTILKSIRSSGIKPLLPFAMLGVLMIYHQQQALDSHDGALFEHTIAALALELQVNDLKLIRKVSPHNNILAIAEKASAQNLSVFGLYPFRDAREQLGRPIQQQLAPPNCQCGLNAAEPIEGEIRFVRVDGWIFNTTDTTYPNFIRFLGGEENSIVGFAFTGGASKTPNFNGSIDKNKLPLGYHGYVLADQIGQVLTLQGKNLSCQIQASVIGHAARD
ncbi:MAG: hypothetical protein ACKN9T_08190 [Candidatus Methylumidiphilus sp.]